MRPPHAPRTDCWSRCRAESLRDYCAIACFPKETSAMSRRWTYFVAALAIWSCCITTYKAYGDFMHPSPPWMVRSWWYDYPFSVLMALIVLAACVVYERRRRGGADQPPRGMRPWREKWELRVVLYSFAAIQLLRIPLAILNTIRATRLPPPYADSFWSRFPSDDVIAGTIIAGLVIIYDRWQVVSEARKMTGVCRKCGYDLRATPKKCPECGTIAVIGK